MKTFVAAMTLVTLTSIAGAALASTTPSLDDCRTLSVHGVWDCR